jgi:hypothetical protein
MPSARQDPGELRQSERFNSRPDGSVAPSEPHIIVEQYLSLTDPVKKTTSLVSTYMVRCSVEFAGCVEV